MYKKLLSLTMALVVACLFLAGCSGSSNQSQSTPPAKPAASAASSSEEPNQEPTEPTASAEPAPAQPSGEGTGTDTDPFNILDIPEFISERYWWEVGNFGYEPRVLKETSTSDYDIVISIPELPEKLANFAQGRGDLYVLVVSRSKNDDRKQADLYFYSESMVLFYDHTVSYLREGGGEENTSYSFYSGNVAFPTITNMGAVWNTEMDLNYDFVYMNTNAEFDEFSDTSYTPTDEEIDAVINAVINAP